MKIKIFYILILFSYGCHSQENWTLYPNKDSINSINKIDTILNQKKIDSSSLEQVNNSRDKKLFGRKWKKY